MRVRCDVVETTDMQLIARVDAHLRDRGIRQGAWLACLGVGRDTWSRWRGGVRAIGSPARALLQLVDDDPALIWRVMELEAGDE